MLKIEFSRHFFRSFFIFPVILLAAVLWQTAATQAAVRDGVTDTNFAVNPISFALPSRIKSFAELPNGKILVIGGFSSISAGAANNIARLNADGSFDETFRGNANGAVNAVFPLADGKILISGDFSRYDEVLRNRVARLNADGSLDASFNPNLGTGYVQAVAIQPDGKIIINGTFTSIGGVARNRLARLNADGSLDLSFEVGGGISNAGTMKGAVLADGKILLAGKFSAYDGVARNGVLRLNSNGSLDTGFVPGIPGSDNEIFDISLTADGKIYVAGDIAYAATIYRLNSDGSLDSSFNTGYALASSGRIYAVLAQPDGKVLFGGSFDSFSVNGRINIRYRLFRFNGDGSVDNTFAPQAGNSGSNGEVHSLKLYGGNKILVGGDFSYLNGRTVGGIGRLHLDGTLDASFVGFLGSFTTINVFHILPDGKVLIGGNFDAVGTSFKRNLARLNADGSLDQTFTVDERVDGPIYSIAVQPDGKILLGGYTGSDYSRTVGKGVWRINADGTLDTTFDVQLPAYESVGEIVVLGDGKILIGGGFTKINNIVRGKIARLNPNGSLDETFSPIISGTSVNALAVQPDGNILVGGGFHTVNNSQIGNLVRLKPDGSIDATFNVGGGPNSPVNSLLLTDSGRIYAGGSFFNFYNRSALVRLNSNGTLDNSFKSVKISSSVNSIVQLPNNKILIGGDVSTFGDAMSRQRIIRLFEDGIVDYSFDAGRITRGTSDGTVYQLGVQPNGKILAVGYFDSVNNTRRWGMAQLNTFARPTPAFLDYEGDGKSDITVFRPSNGAWYRLNSYFNQFRAFGFGKSGDKIAPADFDGDYRTDIAVFRPSEGYWYIQNSSDASLTAIRFGAAEDIPVARDFDGDGRADIAVFRPSNGTWYLLQSKCGFTAFQFGTSGDVPVAADYDGDEKADIAVFRPSNGVWYRINSGNGQTIVQPFGINGDLPVEGDYDGDYKADLAVFRPSEGTWYIWQSSAGFRAVRFGADGDKPVTADYDGDEKADVAVFRAGIWYILYSSTSAFSAVSFGLSSDTPLEYQLN